MRQEDLRAHLEPQNSEILIGAKNYFRAKVSERNETRVSCPHISKAEVVKRAPASGDLLCLTYALKMEVLRSFET